MTTSTATFHDRAFRGATSPAIVRARARRQAWVFMGISVGLAVGAALAAPMLGPGLQFVVALGPAVIALAIAWRTGTHRALAAGITHRPADKRLWLAAALPFAASLAVVPIAMLLGQPTAGLFGKLTPAALILPLVVILPAFAEELAWRGFALPRLLTSMSPVSAALLIAVPWTAMHLPLYLVGQPYAGTALWPSVVSVVALSVLLTWLYVRSGGSILVPTLFHAAVNASTPLTWAVEPDLAWALRPILLAVLAVIVVARGGLRPATPADVR